jgi:hypothetical protein
MLVFRVTDTPESELDAVEKRALQVLKGWKGEMAVDQVGGASAALDVHVIASLLTSYV